MNRNLLILGAGQYGMVAKEVAETMDCFEKIDFLDDQSELAIGKLDDYERFAAEYSLAFVAIGNSELRMMLINQLEEALYTVAILVHSRAYVSPSAQLQKGCIVEPMAVIHTGAVLAIGVIVSAGAVVGHNSFVGDGCHIDCGAVVASNTVIPAGTKVACGSVLGPNSCETKLYYERNYNFEVGM